MERSSRLTWDEYFLGMLSSVAERATCDRGRAACIITKDRQILVTGYVGAPPGFDHCDDVGHLMENGHCVRTVHAEQNALAQAASRGVSLQGAKAYTTMIPCRTCAMLFVTVGIKSITAQYGYQNDDGWNILVHAGLYCTQLNVGVTYRP